MPNKSVQFRPMQHFSGLFPRREDTEPPQTVPADPSDVTRASDDTFMPIQFHDLAMEEPPDLHSGARLAARLNAKIIVNGSEFNNAGEMSVEDRHLYHDALEAAFPPGIALFNREARKTSLKKESLIMVAVRSCLTLAAPVFRLKR